ncbi:MAG: hypothetical protein KAR05_04885 [Candidatus Omnitrophica bacterium]|nr:hypothetical protein [Candidatus Omnitrophota bacterium]
MISRFKFTAIIVLTTFLAIGCSLTESQLEKDKLAAEIKIKKENYANLHQQITSKKLQKALSKEEIKAQFGEPDNVFRSGSSVSSMEIWAYEKILDKKEIGDRESIRLYFDNDKLITWKF